MYQQKFKIVFEGGKLDTINGKKIDSKIIFDYDYNLSEYYIASKKDMEEIFKHQTSKVKYRKLLSLEDEFILIHKDNNIDIYESIEPQKFEKVINKILKLQEIIDYHHKHNIAFDFSTKKNKQDFLNI